MTQSIRITVAIVALLLMSFTATADAERPNIVMIFSDDQGVNDVGCYGSEIATPHIDRIASEGILLRQFYAASSICTPSRFGLFTGQYPHRSKDQLLSALMFLADEDQKRGIHQGERTYPSLLQQAGYRTALVGKWHLGHGDEKFWPTRHGFDTFFGHTGGCVDFFTLQYGNRPDWYRDRSLVETNGYATDVITEEAINILRDAKRDDTPLYLHVSYNAPHFGKGWNADQEQTENVMQPKTEDLKLVSHIPDPLRRSFAAKVVGMDAAIGRLLDTLDELSMSDNTLVIFMTDHGGDENYGGSNLPLRGGKATLFEGGLRVPCVARWPGKIAPGTESSEVACAIDWFPTFGEIVGFDSTAPDGRSIVPLLQGESESTPRTLVWKTGAHQLLGRKSWFAVRDGDLKWVRPPDQQGMLFDLAEDPNETADLAGSRQRDAQRLAALAEKS